MIDQAMPSLLFNEATYRNFHALAANKFHASHNVLLHLHELGELPGKVRAELTRGLATEGVAWRG